MNEQNTLNPPNSQTIASSRPGYEYLIVYMLGKIIS